jgi:hypothetical protein
MVIKMEKILQNITLNGNTAVVVIDQCLPCREMHFSSTELSPVPALQRDAFQFY